VSLGGFVAQLSRAKKCSFHVSRGKSVGNSCASEEVSQVAILIARQIFLQRIVVRPGNARAKKGVGVATTSRVPQDAINSL